MHENRVCKIADFGMSMEIKLDDIKESLVSIVLSVHFIRLFQKILYPSWLKILSFLNIETPGFLPCPLKISENIALFTIVSTENDFFSIFKGDMVKEFLYLQKFSI